MIDARMLAIRRELKQRRDSFDLVPVLDEHGLWVLEDASVVRHKLDDVSGWSLGVLGEPDREGNGCYYSTGGQMWIIRSMPRVQEALAARLNYTEVPHSHQRRSVVQSWAYERHT